MEPIELTEDASVEIYRSSIIRFEDIAGANKGRVYTSLYDICRHYFGLEDPDFGIKEFDIHGEKGKKVVSQTGGLDQIAAVLDKVLKSPGTKSRFLIYSSSKERPRISTEEVIGVQWQSEVLPYTGSDPVLLEHYANAMVDVATTLPQYALEDHFDKIDTEVQHILRKPGDQCRVIIYKVNSHYQPFVEIETIFKWVPPPGNH